jgi:hypothetical protein
MPNRRPLVSEEPLQGSTPEEGGVTVDWQQLGIKFLAVAGGVLVLGTLVWLGVSWKGSGSTRGEGTGVSTGFKAAANKLPVEADKELDEAPKADPKSEKPEAKGLKKNPGVLVDLKKANDKTDALVLGRPDERQHFPTWIAELWNPDAAATPGKTPALTTIKVGRVGSDRATAASLAAAIESLPPQGGLIELRGRGPFILPATKIAHRGRVVIAAASARTPAPGGSTNPNPAERSPASDQTPLIVLVPVPGAASDSGLVALETPLTLYGVDVVAFADQFPGDGPLRLVEARTADLFVQKCSFTLVGSRSGPTIACSVSNVSSEGAPNRPVRVLVDRTLVRGKECAGLEVDLPSVDLLAINSLFVTGKAPALTLTGGSGRAPQPAKATDAARNLRFFSCTTCTGDAAVAQRLGPGATPPSTRFHVLNSVFGAVFEPQGLAMIALSDWPTRPLGANHVAFENLTWETDSFVARGWQTLVHNDKNPLSTKDAGKWAAYWGQQHSTVDDEPGSFANVTDYAAVEPAQFKWEIAAGHASTTAGTSPAGCDVSLLSAAAPEAIVRASVFSNPPTVPPTLAKLSTDTTTPKEIDLDNPNRSLENLAKYINKADWKSGTRFIVRGTNKKVCTPIHVNKRSLTIEFADPAPLLTFEDPKGEVRGDHSAFISVTGGSIQIINANFRVGSTAKRSPRWLLDVKDGNFAIRDSSIDGPSIERPGYEGLIHMSSTRPAGSDKEAETLCGEIRNSFLRTSKGALSGELVGRNLILDNSVLAANGRIFDLRVPIAAPTLSMINLSSCTLAAGEEYFHFDPLAGSGAGAKPAPSVRIVADETVFGPPLQAGGAKSEDKKPLLISGLPPESIASVVEWWEYACAYSNQIGLPNASSAHSRREPMGEWKQIAGAGHIVRPSDGPSAVLLPKDLPAAKDLSQGDFRLKSVAEAATWSDTGTTIGAVLAAKVVLPGPAPRLKTSTGRKTGSSSKAEPKPQPSGI